MPHESSLEKLKDFLKHLLDLLEGKHEVEATEPVSPVAPPPAPEQAAPSESPPQA